MDRAVVVAEEEWWWVPREAIAASHKLLTAIMPAADAKPYMAAVLELNKVWKRHEQERIAALKVEHAEEVAELHRK